MINVPRIFKSLGWNKRPLTFADFEWAAAALGVIVQRAPIVTPGMHFECKGRPVITLSSRLQGVRLWHVAFHELAHAALHPPGLRCFSPRYVSKAEGEAEFLSICSVLDEQTLYRILAHGELHDYPRQLVKERMRIAGIHKM